MVYKNDTIVLMLKKKHFRKPHRIQKRKSIFRSRVFWFGLLGLIFISGCFYLIVFSPWLQIQQIQIQGNRNISSQEIKEQIQPMIERQMILWKTRAIFLANLKEINNLLLNQFPSIGQVKLKRGLPETLVISVREREPVALFYHQGRGFFLDQDGIVFGLTTEEKEVNFLRIESLIFNQEIVLGQLTLEPGLVEKIIKIEQALRKKEIFILRAVIVSEEKLEIETKEGWKIFFNQKNNISKQIFNLGVVINEKISAERRRVLERIDLRFDEIIYISPEF